MITKIKTFQIQNLLANDSFVITALLIFFSKTELFEDGTTVDLSTFILVRNTRNKEKRARWKILAA